MDNIQDALTNTGLKLSDAAKLVGCYKALRDQGNGNKGIKLRRAVGFLSTINDSKRAKNGFGKVVNKLDEHKNDGFTCETKHIDGGDSSLTRNEKLAWLKENAGYTRKARRDLSCIDELKVSHRGD